jgi:hypothetical protein
MNSRATYRCVVTLLTMLFAACATAPRSAHDPMTAPAVPADGVRVVVQNQNWEAMTVFLVRAGSPIRLGIVDGLSTRTLRVPASYFGNSGDVELMGQTRISDVRHRLAAVPWASGRSLHLTLGSMPHLSVIRVF